MASNVVEIFICKSEIYKVHFVSLLLVTKHKVVWLDITMYKRIVVKVADTFY
jgi:hypothetical protein